MSPSQNRPSHSVISLDRLQRYGVDLLIDYNSDVLVALERRGIPPEQIRPLQDNYGITLHLDPGIALAPIQRLLKQQVEAVAQLIRDFQIAVLGQPTSLFHLYEIEIQVTRRWRSGFQFDAGKLLLQLPIWKLHALKQVYSYPALKRSWHQGQQLQRRSPMRKFWWLLNPIGEFRANLRTTLSFISQQQIPAIDGLLVEFGVQPTDETATSPQLPSGQFKEAAIALLERVTNPETLGVDLSAVLAEQNETTLTRLLQRFKQLLTDPQQIETLVELGALTVQEVVSQEKSQVNVTMFGFVNVGNFHRIDVALNLSMGYLRKYIEILPRQTNIKAVLFGFVNVYTVDDITVKPMVQSALKIDFATAALEQAMRDLRLLRQNEV